MEKLEVNFKIEKNKSIEIVVLIIFLGIIFIYAFYEQESRENNQNLEEKWIQFHDLEGVDKGFFINSSEWHYNIEKEKMAACAVMAYSQIAGLDEEWELSRMYSENGMISVFVRSQTYRELFLLLKKDAWLLIADVQRGDMFENKLMEGNWSYYSELDWKSYEDWVYGELDFLYAVKSDYKYYQYDSVYRYQVECAMQDYLFSEHINPKIEWSVMYERFFVSSHGCLVDVWYTNEKEKVHLVLDVWNKLYTIIDVVR